ncbi:MAG TPA: long-chain fatty acid--CoA ligase [Actinomycetota bacterium]|nr:long-chain fatty acid--CoA ligase [Actinomycetota bacterium]
MNLAQLLADAARRTPEKDALRVPGGERYTYRQLAEEAARVASFLRRSGVAAGDRVALAMPNVPRFASAYFGILGAGAAAVPLNAMLTEFEAGAILEDAGVAAVVGAGGPGRVAAAAAAGVGVGGPVVVDDAGWANIGADAEAPVEREEGDLAVLAYTSGTTGAPKGVMLTHGNLLANLRQQMDVPEDRVREDDVVLMALPLFHIFGLNVMLGLTVMNGATGVLLERFDPVPALRAVQEEGVTVLFGAPPMYVSWVRTPGVEQYDLSRVRLAVSGAAPLPPDVVRSFAEITGVDLYEGYGLTETAPALTSNRMGPRPRPGSVGKPLPGVELRVVGDDMEDVEVGDPGEVVVRGPNVFAGYWKRPDETERAFTDGWFHTGDIGVIDEEGYLFLVDRKRDLIIVSGFNVYPSEVEDALVAHPAVAEAAVVGVPHPYTGEAVRAYVTLADGADASEEGLLADVRTRLARFKCPESIEIVDDLPHLLTGKVLRRALRDA